MSSPQAVPSSGAIVLLVSDNTAFRSVLQRTLEAEAYLVDAVEDQVLALARFNVRATTPTVVIFSGPTPDALELCRAIRARSQVPIMIVSDRAASADRVAGLNAGADDCLTPPVSTEELMARLRVLLRRAGRLVGSLRYEDLELDRVQGLVRRGDVLIELTLTEFALLDYLLSYPCTVLTCSRIYENVWGTDLAATSNSLRVYIASLRRKTEVGGRPRLIHTVRGAGYKLSACIPTDHASS